MIRLTLIFIITIALSCTQPGKKSAVQKIDSSNYTILNKDYLDTLQETSFYRAIPEKKLNDSTILITILPGVEIHWNNKTNQLEIDSLLKKIKHGFREKRMVLANEIRNTYETQAIGCPDTMKLAAGDIAYSIIDRIESVPFFELTHYQLDVMMVGCPYPYGLFSSLKNQRAYVTKCVKGYLMKTEVGK